MDWGLDWFVVIYALFKTCDEWMKELTILLNSQIDDTIRLPSEAEFKEASIHT